MSVPCMCDVHDSCSHTGPLKACDTSKIESEVVTVEVRAVAIAKWCVVVRHEGIHWALHDSTTVFHEPWGCTADVVAAVEHVVLRAVLCEQCGHSHQHGGQYVYYDMYAAHAFLGR